MLYFTDIFCAEMVCLKDFKTKESGIILAGGIYIIDINFKS